jgi:spore coat protein U-like protein
MNRGYFLFGLVLALIINISEANAGALTATTKTSATLQGFCSISTTSIAFGNIAAQGTVQTIYAPSQGNVQILCTKGTSYSIQLNAGSNETNSGRRLRGASSGDLIIYAICPTASFSGTWATGQCSAGAWFTDGSYNYPINSTGTGSIQNFPAYGVIQTGYYTPDNYSDSITATVSY